MAHQSTTLTNQQLDQIRDVALEIAGGDSLEDVLNRIYDNFRTLIPYNRIGFSLIEREDGETIARAYWSRTDQPHAQIQLGYSAMLEESSLYDIVQTNKPRILNDLEEYYAGKPGSKSTQLILDEGIRSSLTCPLIAGGNPVGFLFFSSTEKNTYSDIHVQIFELIATQISVIVERVRMYSTIAIQRATYETDLKLHAVKMDLFTRTLENDVKAPLAQAVRDAKTIAETCSAAEKEALDDLLEQLKKIEAAADNLLVMADGE